MCDEDNKQPRMSKQFELSLKTRIIFKFIERLIAWLPKENWLKQGLEL